MDDFWQSPEGQQLHAAQQAAEADLQAWLAEQPGVVARPRRRLEVRDDGLRVEGPAQGVQICAMNAMNAKFNGRDDSSPKVVSSPCDLSYTIN